MEEIEKIRRDIGEFEELKKELNKRGIAIEDDILVHWQSNF